MNDDTFGLLIGFAVLTASILLFIVAATVAIPATVVLGGGYLAWRAYNNSPSTQARRDMAELEELYRVISQKLASKGTVVAEDVIQETLQRIAELQRQHGFAAPVDLVEPVVRRLIKQLIELGGARSVPVFDRAALQNSEQLRSELRQRLYELDETSSALEVGEPDDVIFIDYASRAVGEILLEVPRGATFVTAHATVSLHTRVLDVLPDARNLVDALMQLPFDYDGHTSPLVPLQNLYFQRWAQIAGKTEQELIDRPDRIVQARDNPNSVEDVVYQYLAGSPLLPLFQAQLAYELPAEARFEHMHILAGSGHGKTQLLQNLIADDLAALEAHAVDPDVYPARSVVVIDSQGDLIRNIISRRLFAPDEPLHDRVVIVDPTDVLHPPALNMFDVGQGQFAKLSPNERAALYNGTIELYVYLFSELLGATVTARQATLFRYLAQLLLAIPGATLHTFLAILDDDPDYLQFASELDATAQDFFAKQFVDQFTDKGKRIPSSFSSTKTELNWRLWGLLSNPSLAAMFNSPDNRIDLDAELQRGVVILVNSSKETLKTEGSKLFGRFWVALIAQATLKRAKIPVSDRVATHVYLDEAHEIVDDKVEEILNQARKYRVALTFSHQNLGQLRDNATRASVAASTAIKMIGGASNKDAEAYAGDLRTDSAYILSTKKKDRAYSEFVTFVKNFMDQALKLTVPFGRLEKLPAASADERVALTAANRERYCYDATTVAEPPSRPPPEPEPDEPFFSEEPVKEKDTTPTDDEPYEFKLGDPEDV